MLGAAPIALPSTSPAANAPWGIGVDSPRSSVALRFISASAGEQHPTKRQAGYIYADAVEESAQFIGVADGVSGVQSLGLNPKELPRQLLEQCRKGMDELISRGRVPHEGDGYWLIPLLEAAYDRTSAWGATTVLLAAIEERDQLAVANVGDCALLQLRPVPGQPSALSREYRTDPLRYEANRPVQVMRLANNSIADTHLVIQGARVDTLCCRHGDILVLGSDGIFDNLSDEDIARIVEGECACVDAMEEAAGSDLTRGGRHPSTEQLQRAADALVSTAISRVRVDRSSEGMEDAFCETSGREQPAGNADDTTVVVAAIVEADILALDLARKSYVKEAQARPSFRVRRRAGGAEESPALSFLAGLAGIVPACCNTSVVWEDTFEESVLGDVDTSAMADTWGGSPRKVGAEADCSSDPDQAGGAVEACVVS